MEPQGEAPNKGAPNKGPEARPKRKGWSLGVPSRRAPITGRAMVEFAIAGVAFFLLVFGTVDFGRAVYMYSQLRNAVREGARYGKMNPADTSGIKSRVEQYASAFNMTDSDVTVNCTGGCFPGSSDVTVAANGQFSAITQSFLGISPITMSSTAKV